jgi:RNA polymerase sigma factor (sigma-70 family)
MRPTPDEGAPLRPADRDALIERSMPMARRIAASYRGKRLESDELESVAFLALVEAADRFDLVEHAGSSFVKYAERVIRAALQSALCRAPVVHGSVREERAALKGTRPSWTPFAIPVESLATRPVDPDIAAPLGVVQEVLSGCSELERSLVDLMFVEGKTTRQAAARLGMTPNATRAAYDGAMCHLAGEFKARGFDPGSSTPLALAN